MRGGRQEPYCCDCSIGTIAIDEWYMVDNAVWERAWAGRQRAAPGLRKYYDKRDLNDAQPLLFEQLDRFVYEGGQEILCIGCLEKRIGRTLCRTDFLDVPINDPNRHQHSDRLRDRLAARRIKTRTP
jgi:hypothetical protein